MSIVVVSRVNVPLATQDNNKNISLFLSQKLNDDSMISTYFLLVLFTNGKTLYHATSSLFFGFFQKIFRQFINRIQVKTLQFVLSILTLSDQVVDEEKYSTVISGN